MCNVLCDLAKLTFYTIYRQNAFCNTESITTHNSLKQLLHTNSSLVAKLLDSKPLTNTQQTLLLQLQRSTTSMQRGWDSYLQTVATSLRYYYQIDPETSTEKQLTVTV